MPRLGVIVGLKSEIAAVAPALPPDTLYFAAGGGPDRAADAARRLAREGAELLVSLGLAGGLDPALRCGDLVVAASVIVQGKESLDTAPEWRERLAGALAGAPGTTTRLVVAPIAGSDTAVSSAAAKAALYRGTQAVAVDMESHGVARGARLAGVPFVALRVVADEADRAIPWSAMAGMAPDGSVRPAAVILRLLLRPWEIPALIRLARDSNRAHAALGRVALAAAGALR